MVKPSEVSIVTKQINNTFEPYTAKTGGNINLLQVGSHSADAMINKEQSSNKTLTWILRVVGFFLMFLGINLILKPLSVIADMLPLLGNIIQAGTGIIALLLSAALSLITIAIGWIVYRPLLGILLLIAALGLAFAVGSKLKTKNS